MGTGTTGGQIGNIIDSVLTKKYGKSKSKFYSGIAAMILGMFFCTISIIGHGSSLTINDLTEHKSSIKSVEFVDMSSAEDIIKIKMGDGNQVSILYSLWKNDYKESELVQKLQNSDSIVVWLEPDKEINKKHILGLKTDAVFIDPQIGIDYRKESLGMGLILGGAFVLVGLVTIIIYRR